MTASIPSGPLVSWRSNPAMRYPDQYVWILFFSTMDIILTALILTVGGDAGVDPELEINPLARLVIVDWGMVGAAVFKFCIAVFVIVLCEIVGRRQNRTGRNLAWTCAVISAAPVVWSLALLFVNRLDFFDQVTQPVALAVWETVGRLLAAAAM